MQVPRLSGMLRAFTTRQGNVDIAAQYRQRALEIEARRRSTADAHVCVSLICCNGARTSLLMTAQTRHY